MSQTLQLLTLRAPAPAFDPAKGAEGLPQRILVMPWGNNATAAGEVIVNATTVKMLAAYNAAKNWDRPALDFEHSSVPGSPTYKGEPVKVAGYGTLQVVEGEGIYMLMSSWTQEGKEYAAGGHYGDLSPVVKVNPQNEVIGLHSAALCRHGATPGLIFLSATTATPPTKQTMDAKPPADATELMQALMTLLGMGADAAPGDVLKALSAKLKEEPAKVEASPEETKALSADVAELKKLVTAQSETIKLLSGSFESTQRGEILAQAIREGKEVPKTAATNMPLDQLKLLCAELPVTVPMDKRMTDSRELLLSSSANHGNPEMKALDDRMGISKEDREKYLGHA